jgi:CheY-like chemotaxis protein
MVHILLVDDDPTISTCVEHGLESMEHELQIARDGGEGLALTKQMTGTGAHPYPDIVILDLNMPGMDGPSFLREFRKQSGCKDIPVIILSASTATSDYERLAGLKISGIFPKPLSVEDYQPLGRMIQRVIAKRAA